MTVSVRTAVVICPGRGSYYRSELGVLARHFPDAALLARLDAMRRAQGQETLSDLDGAAGFSAARQGRGDAAAALIFAAALGDFLSIDHKRIEVVAVTGNSMGWYTALSCAAALSHEEGFTLAATMGALMHQAAIGGQLVYPHMGPDWNPDPERKAGLLAQVAAIAARPGHRLALSIDLGGMLVLGGNACGLAAFAAEVPPLRGRFPMRLTGHAAFHTELQASVAERARAHLSPDMFGQPRLPLIDGRGHVWWPQACDTAALWDYTLGHQVTQCYDFSAAIRIAAREFAPDLFIVTGPGTSLVGAVAQSLILCDWRGMGNRAAFAARQAQAPLLVSMGRPDERGLVTRAH